MKPSKAGVGDIECMISPYNGNKSLRAPLIHGSLGAQGFTAERRLLSPASINVKHYSRHRSDTMLISTASGRRDGSCSLRPLTTMFVLRGSAYLWQPCGKNNFSPYSFVISARESRIGTNSSFAAEEWQTNAGEEDGFSCCLDCNPTSFSHNAKQRRLLETVWPDCPHSGLGRTRLRQLH